MTIVNFLKDLNEYYYASNLDLKILIFYLVASFFLIYSWPNVSRDKRIIYFTYSTIIGVINIMAPLIAVPLSIIYVLARITRYVLEKKNKS